MKTLRTKQPNLWQAGTTLIEVLISLLVLSGGMLGMAGVQSVSLRANQAAYYRTMATNFTQDIIERMRANTAGVDAGDYNNAAGAATANCFTAVGCTRTQMARQDILEWRAAIAAAMPNAVAVVCRDSSMPDGTAIAFACDGVGTIYAIKIFWDSDRDGVAEQRFTTTYRPL